MTIELRKLGEEAGLRIFDVKPWHLAAGHKENQENHMQDRR
jgi:hypothetical protein